jgi:tRNA nucleotidyltransferase (CCA-adding enzyme)
MARVRVDVPQTDEVRFAIEIARALNQLGVTTRVAGGYVRDLLLREEPKDLDMCATAHPDVLESLPFKTVATGKQYGTITFIKGDIHIEVTTTRQEHGYGDSRRDVQPVFTYDPVEGPVLDVQRRDLTINGLLLDLLSGRVEDHVGGLKDLEAGKIDFIGNAFDRVRDDALRLFRFVRFASKLGFTIDQEVFDVAHHPLVRKRLSLLSGERVRDEFLGILQTPNASWALTVLLELGLIEMWFPELYCLVDMEQNVWHSEDVWGHTLLALDHACRMNFDLTDRLTAVCHDLGKGVTQDPKVLGDDYGYEAARQKIQDYGYSFHGHDLASLQIMEEEFCPRLKLYGNVGKYPVNVDKVKMLVKGHMSSFSSPKMRPAKRLRHMGADIWGEEMIDRAHHLFLVDTFGRNLFKDYPEEMSDVIEKGARIYQAIKGYVLQEDSAMSVKDLTINGNDVMRLLDIKPSRLVGQVLADLFDKVTNEELPNDAEALERHVVANRETYLIL